MEKFFDWTQRKQQIDRNVSAPHFLSEREIWWIYFGENIGVEMNGKGGDFTRPGLILKRINRHSCLVAPTSTRPHGGPWYVRVRHKGIDEFVCLNQIRVIDTKRLKVKVGRITAPDFKRVSIAFKEQYSKEQYS